jgi:trigger factor
MRENGGLKMDVKAAITNQQGWARTFQVTVPAAEVDHAFDTITERYRKDSKFPGFRPGKATASMAAARFATEIRQDVLEEVIPKAYEAALHQLGITAIGSPKLDKVKLERGSEMVFSIEVEIRPQVDVTGYKGLKLQKRTYEITDREVDPAIEELREMASTFTEVTRPAQDGDVVICDLQKIYDRRNQVKRSKFENVRFDLREGRARPEFLKGVAGMAVGEGKEIEVQYPDDERDPDLAGNTVLFRTWLKSVSQRNLPPADDEFARKVGTFSSLAELRGRVAADLQRRAESASLKDMGRQARRQVVEANPFDVPKGFLEEYLEGVTTRLQHADKTLTAETIRVQFEPMAVEQFRWDYVVYEIARKEGISVTDDEVRQIQATWPDDAKEKPSEEKIRDSLLENKVYDILLANADIAEVPQILNPKIVTP